MAYRLGSGFGAYALADPIPAGSMCPANMTAFPSVAGQPISVAYDCKCLPNLYVLNDPAQGRSCVSSCPPGTLPGGDPGTSGSPGMMCVADPSYVPPGQQINLQTGQLSPVGSPLTSTPANPTVQTPPPAAISSAPPPNLAPGGGTGQQQSASPLVGGFSLSSIPWW